MKVVYVVSKYTSPWSNYKLHLPDRGGRPVCGAGERSFSAESVEGRPTCKKCLKLLKVVK